MNSTAIKRTALLINYFSPLRQCCKGNQVNERAFVLLMTYLCTVLTSHKFIWFFFSFFSVVVITLLGDHFIPRQLITITKYTWLFVTVLDNLKPDQNAREVTSKANNPFKAVSLLGSCFQKADIKHLSHPQKLPDTVFSSLCETAFTKTTLLWNRCQEKFLPQIVIFNISFKIIKWLLMFHLRNREQGLPKPCHPQFSPPYQPNRKKRTGSPTIFRPIPPSHNVN